MKLKIIIKQAKNSKNNTKMGECSNGNPGSIKITAKMNTNARIRYMRFGWLDFDSSDAYQGSSELSPHS